MSPEGLRRISPSSVPAAMAEPPPGEANYHLVLTVLKWYRLILCFGVVVLVAAGIAMLLKRDAPFATARLLIKSGDDPVSGLPTGRSVSPDSLQTEAQLFASRVVLLPVARALQAARGRPVGDGALEDEVEALRANLLVTPISNTTMLLARHSARDGAEAERRLRMIVDSYLEQHAAAYSGSTSFSTFFGHETEQAAAQLRDAEDRLQKWQEANNVVAVEDEVTAQLATIAEFEHELRRTDVAIESTRAEITTLTRDIAALPVQSVTSRDRVPNPLAARLKIDLAMAEAALRDVKRGPVIERLQIDIATAEIAMRDAGASPLAAKLKADLATAEIALHDLRQRYQDEDRRVQEKLEQIGRLHHGIAAAEREAVTAAAERVENLRRQLEAAERDAEATAQNRVTALRTQLDAAEREGEVLGREGLAPNPLREMLNRDVASARARLTALASQRDTLRGQLQPARTALAGLQQKRVHADRLSREIELARALHLQNSKRLDDARVTAGLRRHQLTNVAVIEPPRATASRGNRRSIVLVSLLGGVVGLGLGVATALALEFCNWSLRTSEDVEFYLGVPVVATVPLASGLGPRALPPVDDRPRGSGPPDPNIERPGQP